jgi:hypothetical protein
MQQELGCKLSIMEPEVRTMSAVHEASTSAQGANVSAQAVAPAPTSVVTTLLSRARSSEGRESRPAPGEDFVCFGVASHFPETMRFEPD